ncbi:MAG TPA: ATP-dependent DNA ligase [Burkholderiales bacterium]|nr:ATP-dependent DNA ligase [Burkholderiales bacterium]
MLLADLTQTSRRVAETSRRSEKTAALAECLRRLAPDEIAIAVAFLCGETMQGRLGVGPSTIAQALPDAAASSATLSLIDVDRTLGVIASTAGAGSATARQRQLTELLARATAPEQEFLTRLLYGELRQGALEGVMLEAVARAAQVPVSQVRRASMLAGSVPVVAQAALTEGTAGLQRFSLQLFQPLLPMLAQPAQDVDDALSQLGVAGFEWKLDGARVQVHKSGDEVRVYSRGLNDVTAAVPEIVEAVRPLPVRAVVLDGETIALRSQGRPQPFQVTMRRFGRKLDVDVMRHELPLQVFFFDALRRDDEDLIDRPAAERVEALVETLPSGLRIPRLTTADSAAAQAFLAEALARGHEGIMAKSLDAPYEAGSRGSSWLKIKQAHTLDLAVLAAEWGHGRRRGWLSNLHLGARDLASNAFVMLGKTFKGLTDEMLAWQTKTLLELEVSRDAWTVYVRPELVVEIAVSEIQESAQYPGGLALRFARVKRYRPDKRPEDADTIDMVRQLYAAQVTRTV